MNLQFEGLVAGRDGRAVVGPLTGMFPGPGLHLIVGRAGAGKTTPLMTLAGFLPALAGGVRAGAETWSAEGRVGLAFQNPETLFFLPTVGEEVTYALLARGQPPATAEAAGRDWLGRWGLPGDSFWGRNPLTLSGGEKRRVALAACTVFRPGLVLLDEPLAGLDGEGQDSLLAVLAGLAAEALVIVVTHDVEAFLPHARGLLVLGGGVGEWFGDGRLFLAAALERPELFPLPDWYRAAVGGLGLRPGELPPWPTADALWATGAGRR